VLYVHAILFLNKAQKITGKKMIAKLAAESCEIPAQKSKSIEHLVYRMAVLTNEDNPLDAH
jgi:hypothetical protein